MQQPPLSLYIHFPWCIRKCPYCDFNSHKAPDSIDESRYVEALFRDLEHSLPLIWGRSISSIFIGGGTPSLFSGDAIQRLLAGVRSRLKVLPEAEITLEANPGAVDTVHFEGYRQAGVNRLSIGVQSFDDQKLETLGRVHSADDAQRAFATARAAGFDNINLDLMFGLPAQTTGELVEDLAKAIELAPEHLSAYQLTLEPNTPFYQSPPQLPPDEMLSDMQDQVAQTLSESGYARYEVSVYAQPGKECRHNRNYWEYGDYLGIGAGAHGKLTMPDWIVRQARRRHPQEYMRKAGTVDAVSTETRLNEGDLVLEFAMNAFRLKEGFELGLFSERTGAALECLMPGLEKAESLGLASRDGDRVCATEKGFRFLNDLFLLF